MLFCTSAILSALHSDVESCKPCSHLLSHFWVGLPDTRNPRLEECNHLHYKHSLNSTRPNTLYVGDANDITITNFRMLDKYDKLSLNPFTHVTNGLRLEKSEDHPDIQEHSWGVHAGCRICAKGTCSCFCSNDRPNIVAMFGGNPALATLPRRQCGCPKNQPRCDIPRRMVQDGTVDEYINLLQTWFRWSH